VRLDDIDRQLIDLLRRDGRMPHTALGKAVGLSSASIHARVQQLEQAGVIKGYAALVDGEKLGQQIVAFIHVTTQPNANEYTLFERFAVGEPAIVECHDVTGDDNYILKVELASLDELRDLLARIRTLPPVTQTRTSLSLARVKDYASIRPLAPGDSEADTID
jgi:Lrp/AsnC family leucine-responsive transcriptional regulator